MQRKVNQKLFFSFTVLCLFLKLCATNSSTNSARQIKYRIQDWHKVQLNLSDGLTRDTTIDDTLNKTDSRVNMLYLIWPLFIFVMSNVLFKEIFAYLNDQPTNKQCLLLYLYKDLLSLFLIGIWATTSVMIWYKFIRKGTSADDHQAFIISILLTTIRTLIVFQLNIVCLFKLYILKTKRVDPLDTHFFCNDEHAIGCIRYFHSGLALSIMAIIFGTDSKLATYYAMKSIQYEFSDCLVFERTINGLFTASFLLGLIATKIVEKRQDLRQDSYHISFDVKTEEIRIDMRGQRNDAPNYGLNKYDRPSTLHNTTASSRIAGSIWICWILMVLWLFVFIVNYNSDQDIYKYIVGVQFILGVILPLSIFGWSSALTGALMRRIFNKASFALQRCTHIWNLFLRHTRSNMIEPVE